MRRIAHISDLHFGTEDTQIVDALVTELNGLNTHLIALSGDLTQRARRHEFAAARAFLNRLNAPTLIVPGNHDIPLYDLGRRFLRPLHRYRRYITDDLSPIFVDEEIAVLGINTARSATWKNGRISLDQIRGVRTALCGSGDGRFRIVVTHHPFLPPPTGVPPQLVGRGPRALQTMQACQVDMLLAGHLHLAYIGDVRTYHLDVNRSILVAQAGTAVSRRRRGEPNAFNVIDLDNAASRITIGVRVWEGTRFVEKSAQALEKVSDSWQAISERIPPPAPRGSASP